MASVFVSHSRRDLAATEKICQKLRDAGILAMFVDFDPEDGIPAGRHWERELYAQLRRTDAVIFLASAASTASLWCFSEASLARSLGKPVFPVRLQAGVQLPLLDDVQWVDFDDAGFDRLMAGLRSTGIDPTDNFAWNPRRSPYPGLSAFTAEDAAVFFGRARETARLLELLQPTLQRGPGRFVAVVGPSGSGKSSLLHAGLLPRLARLPDRWILVPTLRPGPQPTVNLARCLAKAFASRGRDRTIDELANVLSGGGPGLVTLAEELAELGRNGRTEPNVLVTVDQAEELLTRAGPTDKQMFLKMISSALGDESPLWVVATVRSEFLSSDPDRVGLAEAVDDPLVIEPLSRARLAEVIAGPAARAGLEFDPGLVERMAEETAGGDALPLLAYTLRELCQHAGPDGKITIEAYEASGGVIGALQRRADRLTEELERRGPRGVVVPTLVQLAAVTGQDQPTRNRMPRSKFNPFEQDVIDAFINAHLLTSNHTFAGEMGESVATVEVAHEALLRQWRPLRNAIEANRDTLRKRSELERLAADWEQGQRDESYLLRGGRLGELDDWAGYEGRLLSELAQTFLEASRVLARRELDSARRSNRRLRALAGGLGLLLVLSLVATSLAVFANRRAEEQTNRAQEQTGLARLQTSRRLAAEAARLVLEARPDTAALAGLQSIADGQQIPPPPALIAALAQMTHTSQSLTGLTSSVLDMHFEPDGRHLTTAGFDGATQLWDTATGQPSNSTQRAGSELAAGRFSPDGHLIAAIGADGTVRFTDVGTGRPNGQPLTSKVKIDCVAFSPDGQLIATGQADGTVQIWDTTTRKSLGGPLIAHAGTVTAMAFSPDGQLLATGGRDATIRLWDAVNHQPHGGPLTGHTDVVSGLTFSPSGMLLASVSHDQTVRLWDTPTGKLHGQPLKGHSDQVLTAAFSSDGKLLATAGTDRSIRLWNVAAGQPQGLPLTGHSRRVTRLLFSPDGAFLATGGDDRTVRLWNVAESYALSRSLEAHTAPVNDVAIRLDGKMLATASDDQTLRLWERDGSTFRLRGDALLGSRGAVTSVAFSPDGHLLASATADQTVQLWETASGRQRGLPLAGHQGAVRTVAFSPDGRILATAGDDRAIRLWTLDGGTIPKILTGHTDAVNAVVFSKDSKLLISAGADQTVRVWDVATGQPHGPALTDHTAAVRAATVSANGRFLATAGDDQTVLIWEMSELSLPPAAAPSQQGSTGNSGPPTTRHPSTEPPTLQSEPTAPDAQVELGGSAGNPSTLVSASGSASSPNAPFPLAIPTHLDLAQGRVNDLAFSPDSSRLAIASEDGTVQLWNMRTRERSGRMLTDRTTAVHAIAFSPDGRQLVGAGEDATVRLWDPRFTSWKESVCGLVNHNLTWEEWREIAEDLPYERTCPGLPSGYGAPSPAAAAEYPE